MVVLIRHLKALSRCGMQHIKRSQLYILMLSIVNCAEQSHAATVRTLLFTGMLQ